MKPIQKNNPLGKVRQRILLHSLKGYQSQRRLKSFLDRRRIAFTVLNEQVIELLNVTQANADLLDKKYRKKSSEVAVFFDHFDPRVRPKEYKGYSHVAPNRFPNRKPRINTKEKRWKKLKGSFLPTDLAKIYRLDCLADGDPTSKPTIGVISLGGSFLVQDLENYWTQVCGMKQFPSVSVVSVDGAAYVFGEDEDSDRENTLDIEMIGGIHPNCNIVVYSAPNTDTGFYNAISTALYDRQNNPSVISISWGAPEDESATSVILATSQLFAKAAAKGINIVVAAGDNGSGDGEDGIHVDFPASSPFVIACGGTSLRCTSNEYSDPSTQEVAWSWNREYGWGTGGGLSSIFDAPAYQTALKPNGFNKAVSKRAVPDLAAVADPRSPITILFKGNLVEMGGTSAVAPMYAAFFASLRVKNFLTPILYQARKYQSSPGTLEDALGNPFHDILKGSNPKYTCGPGYTCVCGCGTLDGFNFVSWLRAMDPSVKFVLRTVIPIQQDGQEEQQQQQSLTPTQVTPLSIPNPVEATLSATVPIEQKVRSSSSKNHESSTSQQVRSDTSSISSVPKPVMTTRGVPRPSTSRLSQSKSSKSEANASDQLRQVLKRESDDSETDPHVNKALQGLSAFQDKVLNGDSVDADDDKRFHDKRKVRQTQRSDERKLRRQTRKQRKCCAPETEEDNEDHDDDDKPRKKPVSNPEIRQQIAKENEPPSSNSIDPMAIFSTLIRMKKAVIG